MFPSLITYSSHNYTDTITSTLKFCSHNYYYKYVYNYIIVYYYVLILLSYIYPTIMCRFPIEHSFTIIYTLQLFI